MYVDIYMDNNYYGKYAPREFSKYWVFMEVQSDDIPYPHLLPSVLWTQLRGCTYHRDWPRLKYYKSRADAFRALEKAQRSLARKAKFEQLLNLITL
jgi:hypothetical protein